MKTINKWPGYEFIKLMLPKEKGTDDWEDKDALMITREIQMENGKNKQGFFAEQLALINHLMFWSDPNIPTLLII